VDRLLDERPLGEDRPDAYATIPELYDLEHADLSDDVDLYRQFAYATGDPILELACGTGRILVPLAGDGHRVTGIDRSGPMLERARTALAGLDAPPEHHLVTGEMTGAASAPGGPFGLVIIGLNSLMHAETQAEQRQILTAARQACDPRGQLIVDVINPTPEHLQSLTGTALDGTWDLPDGTLVMKTSDRRHSAAEQTIATTMWYDLVAPDGSLRRQTTSFSLRYLHHSELLLLLELSGWVDFEVYGSWELDPLTDTSERLIVTAQRTPSDRYLERVERVG
jgi:SAM-dependent methyltransferase